MEGDSCEDPEVISSSSFPPLGCDLWDPSSVITSTKGRSKPPQLLMLPFHRLAIWEVLPDISSRCQQPELGFDLTLKSPMG